MQDAPSISKTTEPLFFRSGCSSPKDFQACVTAGVAAGISMTETSAPVLRRVGDYLATGAQVFVDSGAFGAFRKGQRLTDADYAKQLDACLTLAARATAGHLHVVAPDVIGDQDATVALLSRYAPRLQALAAAGAVVIIPLQRGSRSLADFYASARQLFSPFEISAGLPFNASALSTDETLDFIRAARPARVHFLGAARNRRFQNVLAEVRAISPGTAFTYDAAVVRSICGEINCALVPSMAPAADAAGSLPGFAEVQAAQPSSDEQMLFGHNPLSNPRAAGLVRKANSLLDAETIDSTEISPYLNPGDDIAIRAAAYTVGVTEAEFRANMDESERREEIEDLLGEHWELFVDLYARMTAKRDWRVNALANHPVFSSDPHARVEQGMLAL